MCDRAIAGIILLTANLHVLQSRIQNQAPMLQKKTLTNITISHNHEKLKLW